MDKGVLLVIDRVKSNTNTRTELQSVENNPIIVKANKVRRSNIDTRTELQSVKNKPITVQANKVRRDCMH